MSIVAKLDELGKPAWIALMILGFIVWWPWDWRSSPFMIWSGRMGCWTCRRGCWHEPGCGCGRRAGCSRRLAAEPGGSPPSSSGNRAFDEYRTETLRRLEDEQREFRDFLERLRFAKDKAEFDQFMAERRNRPSPDLSRRAKPPPADPSSRPPPWPCGGSMLFGCGAGGAYGANGPLTQIALA